MHDKFIQPLQVEGFSFFNASRNLQFREPDKVGFAIPMMNMFLGLGLSFYF